MDVSVNIGLIYDTLGVLVEKSQLLRESNAELKRILSEIGEEWKTSSASGTTDREEYYNLLNKQIQKIDNLGSSLVLLKKLINNYVDELKTTSSNTLQ